MSLNESGNISVHSVFTQILLLGPAMNLKMHA